MRDSVPEFALKCDGVSFSYDSEVNVLTSCSASFEFGNVNYVVGPSGCGKSTLGLLLCGILTPESGKIDSSDGVKPTMVLQFPENLFLTDSVEDELSLLPDAGIEEHALSMLASFNLPFVDIAQKSPHRLSFGQRRLLAIAIQASIGAKAVVLDEPSLGLDEAHLEEFSTWLKSTLEDGICTVVITHDMDLIRMRPGKVNIMSQGQVKWFGASEEFLLKDELLQLAAAQ